MGFLRILESIRNPVLNVLMQAITYLGEELVFLVLALILFWCISKKHGYYLLIVCFFGTAINQALKLIYRIPRPWVLDPDFTIVESARAGATGYSFPSGHTQNAIGTFGVLACVSKRRWLQVACVVAAIAVAFSRMYLGVHTPLDVGVSAAIAVVLVALLYVLVEKGSARIIYVLFGVMLACMGAYLVFVNCYPFPAEIDTKNLAEGIKNGYSLSGALVGLLLTYILDEKKLHFDVRAPFWGQVLKVVLGLVCVLIIKEGLKAVFNLIAPGVLALNTVRYFGMVAFAGCVWPRTFPRFQRLGRKGEPV